MVVLNVSSHFDSRHPLKKLNILSIYTPTLCSAQERKDKVYEEPNAAICKIPKSESVTSTSGDLIATLDRRLDNDIYHKLCITNIFSKLGICIKSLGGI